jgi:hypothetical protein
MLGLQVASGNSWRFNDFYAYWLAGRLVATGHSPYDSVAFVDLARNEGLDPVGIGYSYPPLFAVLMVPISTLPPATAAWIFTAVSVAAFGLATSAILQATPYLATAPRLQRAATALAVGLYPPVTASLVIGQVNLLILSLMSLGILALGQTHRTSGWRELAAGAALGVAACIKLVPGAMVVPLVLARRWRSVAAMLIAAGVTLVFAGVIAPNALRGSGSLVGLLYPDAYWTNQSINGFVTRFVQDSDRTRAIAVDFLPPVPATVVLTAAFALATIGMLLRRKRDLDHPATLDLALAFVLVAATAGAPKASFNTHVFALLGVALLTLRLPEGARNLAPTDVLLLGLWLAGAVVQACLEPLKDTVEGPLGTLRTLGTSSALYGLVALWLLLGRRLTQRSGSY